MSSSMTGAIFSFDMLTAHRERGLHAVFRIPGNANPTFDAFIASEETDRVFDLAPPRKAAHLPACPVRLVKYSVAETDYCLATSLHDSQRYSIRMLADLYHGRWSIEELYKTSKTLITEFHAKSEHGIRQELYAMFTLVALTRIFTNRCDSDIKGDTIDDQPDMRTNLINGARLIGREVETPVPQTKRDDRPVRHSNHDRSVILSSSVSGPDAPTRACPENPGPSGVNTKPPDRT